MLTIAISYGLLVSRGPAVWDTFHIFVILLVQILGLICKLVLYVLNVQFVYKLSKYVSYLE